MRKPRLFVSKCLNYEKCRFDGQSYNDKIVSMIKECTDMQTICPEKEIGLEVPRNPIRIEKNKNEYRLIQLKTNADYTSKMNEFADEFINGLEDVDGFILKSKSPSCGLNDVKIYPKGQKCSIRRDGKGFFAQKLTDKFINLPIEDEGRLKNYSIRDEFFTRVFTINNLKAEDNIFNFHKKNYLLLKSYDEDITYELENIVNKPNINDKDIETYKNKIYDILSNKRKRKDKIRVINILFDRYKEKLKPDEIKYFENLLKLYDEQKVPFSSLKIALDIYALRFNDSSLLEEAFLNPYPKELINVSDSGKGRDY